MATHLEGVTAALEYEYNNTTHFLTKPDPEHLPIRFTLHVDATYALFDILIPIRYKDKTSSKTINIRINPSSITSLERSTQTSLPDDIFPSATCLELQLSDAVTILVPSLVKEPVAVARPRSGRILTSLYEISHVSKLRIYIPEPALSIDELDSLSTAIAQRKLQPFSDPDHDISRMFSGSGAKATTLPAPLPPSYDKVVSSAPLYNESNAFDPPNTRSRKRQRSQEILPDSGAIWNKLQKLEALIQHSTPASDESLLVQELRAEVAQLKEHIATCQKRCTELELEVASLRETRANVEETEAVELAEIREDIETLDNRIDFIERGKDDEAFGNKIKGEIFDELAGRVKGS
jgi:hypothetical protein